MHRRGGDFTGRRRARHTGMRPWRSSGPSLPPVAAGRTRSSGRAGGGRADGQGAYSVDGDGASEPVRGCAKAQARQPGPAGIPPPSEF